MEELEEERSSETIRKFLGVLKNFEQFPVPCQLKHAVCHVGLPFYHHGLGVVVLRAGQSLIRRAHLGGLLEVNFAVFDGRLAEGDSLLNQSSSEGGIHYLDDVLVTAAGKDRNLLEETLEHQLLLAPGRPQL